MYLGGPAAGGSGRADLTTALAHRVAGLAETRRQILGAAALLGEGATPAEVARVVECSEDDVAEAVSDPASGATVVDGRIRLSHELLRDAFIDAMPVRERQRLHITAARVIGGAGVGQVVRRAHHAVAAASSADQRGRAVAACAQAAAALQRTLAFRTGRRVGIQRGGPRRGRAAHPPAPRPNCC
jgi:hypothetical protein